ncbi:FecR domain-containing protein [Candidatus Peregrinibacteria bacterium]|nr:FecR domain-containing protein [Candidatus Peregrinibacteria bacterium]
MAKTIKDEANKLHLFIFAPKQNKSVAGMIIKNLFLGLIGFAICALTLYADNTAILKSYGDKPLVPLLKTGNESVLVSDTAGQKTVVGEYELKAGNTISTGASKNVFIILPENAVLRLDADTDLQMTEMSIDKIDKKEYRFLLEKGKAWVNTKYDDINLILNTEYLTLEPRRASFNVSYNGESASVFAYQNDVNVKIIFSNEEINSFWLAEGNSVQILNSKIIQKYETIKKLLYSKLTKEFNYGRMSQQALQADPWIQNQINSDNEYAKTLQSNYYASIRESGLKSVSVGSIGYEFKNIVLDLRTILTLTESKKIVHVVDALFENLNDSKYLFIQNNNVDANIRLSIFKEDILLNQFVDNDYFTGELYSRLKAEFYKALVLNPSDNLYPVKNEVLDQILKSPPFKSEPPAFKFQILTDRLNDVSSGVSVNPEASLQVFRSYFKNYRGYIDQYKNNLKSISDEIKRQNILVDNIISKYPRLFNLEIIQNKQLMEEDYINTLQGENDKKEQRQTFISNKIDLLSRIKFFLFDNVISLEDARQTVFALIEDIEEMKKETLDVAAVNELFNKRLSDFGIFWQYLNSPEYSTTPLHGASHEQRYEAFKKVHAEYVSFQEVQNEILGSGEAEEAKTVENILVDAEKSLNDASIRDVEFGFYNDVNQTRIPLLKARASGIEFRGTYDWEKKLLANIMVGDKLISTDGIKLENVNKFIVQTITAQNQIITVQPTTPSQQQAEDPQGTLKNAAKVFVAEKFSKSGMVITKDSVIIKDFDNGEYEVNDVYYSENKNCVFSFIYKSKEDKILDLAIQTDAGLKQVTDTFVSTFLKPVVLKIYEEAKIS